jgi:chromosome segregation ATPase
MSEIKYNNIFFNPELRQFPNRDGRAKSSKSNINERKMKNLINSIKSSIHNPTNNLRYSLDKPKLNKNEAKLAKILLFKDTNNSIKFQHIHKNKIKENELNIILAEDRIKIKNLEDKIKEQKKLVQEKKNKIKKMNENNNKIKEQIKEKENNIEKIKKNINDFKKLNEELVTKINTIKNSQINNNVNDSNLDNSNDLDFENSREREDAINYLLSMMVDLPQQQYPNVDNMTYEELLELEEKMGKVSNGLTDDEIKQLKHEKFIKYKYLEDKCIVCQYDFKELETIVALPCKHCFHFPCIKPWITTQHHCPLCKKNIRNEDK